MPSTLLKVVFVRCIKPLLYLFYLLEQEIFPSNLKIAHVALIFKTGNEIEIGNYRLI